MHRFDVTNVICDLSVVWQQFADGGAAFACLGELEWGFCEREILLVFGHASDTLVAADFAGQLLAVEFFEFGFVVEQIVLRRSTGLEQIDHSFRLGRDAGEYPVRGL